MNVQQQKKRNPVEKKKTLPQRDSIKLAILHQEQKVSGYELVKRYGKDIPERTIYRHAKRSLDKPFVDRRHKNIGRPKKLTCRMERTLLRTLTKLRKDGASFTAGRILEESGLECYGINSRDVCRCLRKNKYRYLQSRKKGLLSANDKKLRVAWAKENVRKPLSHWQKDVCFYLDGVGFAHKSNPAGEARAVSSMTWRKPDEGLEITTKGRKEGSGGKMANFFVAVSYNKGVVMCHRHEWRINGANFSNMIKEEFPKAFRKCDFPESRTFLMDGCPKQNAAVCKNTWERKKYKLVKIPVRSPDLNIIENLFHLIRKRLRDDAKNQNITQESYDEFVARIEKTFAEFPVGTINNLINSIPKRLRMVIKKKGIRTKY